MLRRVKTRTSNLVTFRTISSNSSDYQRNMSTGKKVFGLMMFSFGFSYASIPLYEAFCQATGFGGTTMRDLSAEKLKQSEKKHRFAETLDLGSPTDRIPLNSDSVTTKRLITIEFDSMAAPNMPWSFTPSQRRIEVYPGETALVF